MKYIKYFLPKDTLIEANKEKYYSRISKMMNPLTNKKTYWSILK